ncbi:hypothetical protein [Vulcanisaeta distributa]|uniref:hypothetical protein n=1 Tax=Vulcanisaeta distributa TaxID=164451 RepID=UPI0006CF6BEC|nr:hypothetical protein [Vulcanisaeta distributa]
MLGGVKARGNKRLKCGNETDETTRKEALKLINVFLNRVEKHKDILLSDEKSPFDVYINDLSKFIEYLRIEMSEGGNEKVSEARNAMLRIAEIMLKLSRKARKRWLKLYKVELEELIVKLTKGEMTIPVTGDINNKNRSFIVHMYTNHIAINACRIARNGNITVKFTFTGLKGEHIESPKLFNDSILKAMQYGLLLTDGSIYQGYPGMATHQMWQSIVWHLVFPGKNYIAIDGISINDNISTVWQLTSLNYKFEGKSAVNIKRGFVGGEVVGFDDWLFLWFLLFAVFGDGNVDVQDEYDVREIRLFMGGGKYVLWRPIIERLSGLGFRGGGEYGWEWVVRG